MPTVTFLPDGATLEVEPGTRLLAAVLRAGRPIGYSCRGLGVCVACRLQVAGPLSPPGVRERRLLARLEAPHTYRIACLARVLGDVQVRADYW